VARLESSGDADAAQRLRDHRGAWLLGDITAEEYREYEAVEDASVHRQAVDVYIAAHAECRETLQAAYDAIIKEAKFIRRDEEATGYEDELQVFQTGSYVPTPVEVLTPKPFDVRRIATGPRLAMPESATKIPDELYVEFREHSFCIAGVKRIEGANIDGKQRKDFGKGVAFLNSRGGTTVHRGCLMIGTRDQDVRYGVFTANKSQFTLVVPFADLELDTVYEWSIEVIRDDYRVEVRRGGVVVASSRTFGGTGSVIGFFATTQHVGTQARMVVAVE
jgi:hypothetical protein